MSFHTTTRSVGAITVVDLVGDLTLANGSERVGAMLGKLVEEGEPQLIVNCTGLEQVDSAGMGEIVRWQTRAAQRGVKLKLAGARARLAALLKSTGVDQLIEVFP